MVSKSMGIVVSTATCKDLIHEYAYELGAYVLDTDAEPEIGPAELPEGT
jgi:hypothetical protein